MLEKLLDDISFRASDTPGAFNVSAAYVSERLEPIMHKEDLSRYIL